MNVAFNNDDLDRLEADGKYTAGYQPGVVKELRRRLQQIRAAPDERVLYSLRSLNFEKLKGKRDYQYSMRLNNQYRLILEFENEGSDKITKVTCIEDYH